MMISKKDLNGIQTREREKKMYELKKGAICPQCEKGKLKEIRKDLKFKFKEGVKKFPGETLFICDVCDYEAFNQSTKWKIEEEKAKIAEEKRKAEEIKIKARINKLDGVIFNGQEAIDGSGVIIISREDLVNLPDSDFEKLAKSHNKIMADKRAERETEIKAQAEKELKEKQEREAEEKAEQEAKEKAERERQAALLPDKEKLIAYANSLLDIVLPDVSSQEAENVKAYAFKVIGIEANEIIRQAKEL